MLPLHVRVAQPLVVSGVIGAGSTSQQSVRERASLAGAPELCGSCRGMCGGAWVWLVNSAVPGEAQKTIQDFSLQSSIFKSSHQPARHGGCGIDVCAVSDIEPACFDLQRQHNVRVVVSTGRVCRQASNSGRTG